MLSALRRLFAVQASPQILDPTLYYENRCAAVKGEKAAYPHQFRTSHTLTRFTEEFGHLQRGEKLDRVVTVAGRLISLRNHGKLNFYTLQSDGASLQVMAEKSQYTEGDFEAINASLRRGDILGVRGSPTRTSPRNQPGEISIIPTQMQVLSPCLHMLPGHSGLKDAETRFRKRYLDLIVNKDVRDTFVLRSRFHQLLREFLGKRGFLEVETPMMNLIPGGAAAKPFSTHLNELNLDLFLRIAPELYLKSLIVGGMEKVFEVGKQFRNEGIDQTHNPEFTTCEAYWAYADYTDMMTLTEDLLSTTVQSLTGSPILQFHANGKDHPALAIDFTPPYQRLPFIPSLESALNVSFPSDLTSEAATSFLTDLCQRHNIPITVKTNAKMLDKLMEHFVQRKCVNPTFIVDHPQVMSPLAKPHRSVPGVAERFELIASTFELCNAYTELNDPFLQRALFTQQNSERQAGDEEALLPDSSFLEALEHGLPPTAGWGLGIDRLIMLLADHQTIKEVILFPLMKPN